MFFFFQAEDGIRDLTVTGVQTCALPILIPVSAKSSGVGMRFTTLLSFAIGTFPMLLGEAGARCASWVLHPSAFERSNDREPSRSGRCSPEQLCEGIVVVI